MSFQTTERTLAVSPELLSTLFPSLLATYGEDLPDGPSMVRTIGGHWDDTEHTRMRAASFPSTITGIPLTDGRIAFRCLWQADLAAAFDRGEITGPQQLSESQFASLLPQPEPME